MEAIWEIDEIDWSGSFLVGWSLEGFVFCLDGACPKWPVWGLEPNDDVLYGVKPSNP